MRFMVIIKATTETEAGVMPSEKLLTEMGRYNEELVKAGVMQAGEGLHPSSKGARVKFSGSKRTVIDGPFGETKDLIAGFWLWQVKSKDEAIEWVKRCPNPTGTDAEIEIRQVFEAEDFGAEFTPE
ncbi:MAG TPA: YciI family protein, partial [Candidatus Eisenbacteria bacterium]|nr:YciI family protein [Candidatus Eisenbacteria bacterium]